MMKADKELTDSPTDLIKFAGNDGGRVFISRGAVEAVNQAPENLHSCSVILRSGVIVTLPLTAESVSTTLNGGIAPL